MEDLPPARKCSSPFPVHRVSLANHRAQANRFDWLGSRPAPSGKDRKAGFAGRINKVLLQTHTPPALVINLTREIFYIHGRTGRYLGRGVHLGRWTLEKEPIALGNRKF
jgi:hypothetical protein